MPSQHDQVSYFRAQLAHREAQQEQVRAERDNHFIQEEEEEEEEVLAHMLLLSSEAKDWKSRVVTEADQVLCQESAQAAHHATEVQEAMDKQFQPRWRVSIGDQLKQNSETRVDPAGWQQRSSSKCSSQAARHNWNTSSSVLLKRDSFNLRHKPSSNHNNKKNMRIL